MGGAKYTQHELSMLTLRNGKFQGECVCGAWRLTMSTEQSVRDKYARHCVKARKGKKF